MGYLRTPASRACRKPVAFVSCALQALRGVTLFVALTLVAFTAPASVVYSAVSMPGRQLAKLQAHDELVEDYLLSDEAEANSLYMDKMWHGLHWLVARRERETAAPASRVIMGGKAFGKPFGLDQPKYFTSAEVQQIAKLLASTSIATLKKNFDPQAMDTARIYPTDWVEWERSGDDPFGALTLAFKELQAFYARAAKAKHAVVIFWN